MMIPALSMWCEDRFTVSDPGFPRGEVPTLQGTPTYNFAKFSKNCMKLKEFEPGGVSKILLCRSATGSIELHLLWSRITEKVLLFRTLTGWFLFIF